MRKPDLTLKGDLTAYHGVVGDYQIMQEMMTRIGVAYTVDMHVTYQKEMAAAGCKNQTFVDVAIASAKIISARAAHRADLQKTATLTQTAQEITTNPAVEKDALDLANKALLHTRSLDRAIQNKNCGLTPELLACGLAGENAWDVYEANESTPFTPFGKPA